MKITVLGTGDVGSNLADKMVDLGHEVKMGSRTPEKAKSWAEAKGGKASGGSFAEAAAFGEIVFNCTLGEASLDALREAGADNLDGKVLIDVSNPLDFSKGMPPSLSVSNTDSLGERVQRAFPSAKVVKALNMVGHDLHVNPGLLKGEHDLFICGNDEAAKAKTTEDTVTHWFGWKNVIDLGGITACRGMEMYVPLWLTIAMKNNFAPFNIKIVR